MSADSFCWVLVYGVNQQLHWISDFVKAKICHMAENHFSFAVTYQCQTENHDLLLYLKT